MTIDDPTVDSRNPSCLLNRSGKNSDHLSLIRFIPFIVNDDEIAWQYGGRHDSIRSSLTILAKALKSNQTYQFMVQMENRLNATVKATGYVLVRVEDTQPQLVIIA